MKKSGKKRLPDHNDSGSQNNKNYLEELVKEGEREASNKNFEIALEIFDEAIRIDPLFDIAYVDKALVFEKMGRLDDSLKLTLKTLEINPKNVVAWHNRGLMLIKKKKYAESIDCFDKAISLDENYAKAWYNKGRCLEMQGQTESAQFCLIKAKKLDPFLFSKIKFR
jgi:tetratricopeptide (TPR) repeat protein